MSRIIVDSAYYVQALVFSFVYFKTCLTLVKRMVAIHYVGTFNFSVSKWNRIQQNGPFPCNTMEYANLPGKCALIITIYIQPL